MQIPVRKSRIYCHRSGIQVKMIRRMKKQKTQRLELKSPAMKRIIFYPFVINPLAYKEFKELGVTDGTQRKITRILKEQH
mgnify:CR=1 FL=1